MRDIPMFTTQYGIASLTLKEIPYQGIAYIRIHDSKDPECLLEECVSFCRAAGAEKIFATGHNHLERYPLHTTIIKMTCPKDVLGDTEASVFPVQENTLDKWRNIYNQRMKNIDNAAYMTKADAEKMVKEGGLYFVHRKGELLGIGIARQDAILAIASVVPRTGKDVLFALSHALFADTISLEVASTNERAVSLYRSVGFLPVAEISRWYKIL